MIHQTLLVDNSTKRAVFSSQNTNNRSTFSNANDSQKMQKMSLSNDKAIQNDEQTAVQNTDSVVLSQLRQDWRQDKVAFWSPKQRRCYHRILSGYKLSQFFGQRLRFMTLTTSNDGRNNDLKRDFNTLVKRIRRHYGRFEYLRVRTDEGNGVLHVIYRGSYIPRSWLQSQWIDIHKSWNVDIRDTQRYHCTYIINQYLSGQSAFVRYSTTLSWIFKGAVAQWNALKKSFWRNPISGIAYQNRVPVDFVALWNTVLYDYAQKIMQKTLPDFV